ncbi:MAG: helix-turn-helix domain-containing protein [Kiritimatiellales bacterium]
MANVMKALKGEISRIARMEVNAALKPIKSVNANQRKYIADLRRRIELLEKEKRQLEKVVSKAVPQETPAAAEAPRSWISGQGVRAMRKRLKLSQAAFAKAAGVSLPTVVNWESSKNTGKLKIRQQKTFDRLMQLKGMSRRDLDAE